MADETQQSKDLTVPEAANAIAELPDYASVLAFVGDDDRKGVVEAVDRRAAELAVAPSAPTSPDGVTRLGLGDSPASKPGKPLEKAGSGNVTVRTPWPIDSFEHGISGLPIVTAQGVEVPRSKAGNLLDKAAEAGIELEEVE